MDKVKRRSRVSNWNHEHTMALAELKREASLHKEEGRLVWERIAQTLSSRFPGQIRTGDQCRRRWDTLVKVYNHVEDYCVVTGAQDHRELYKGEWDSMKLDTAYQQDWYDIVKEVCSRCKRKERCHRDPMLAKRSKESSTGSHSIQLSKRPPTRDARYSASTIQPVTRHGQETLESATTHAQVSSNLESDKVSPEEEVAKLKNGSDGLVLELPTATGTQVSSSRSLEVDKLSPEKEVLRLNGDVMLSVAPLRQHGQGFLEVSQKPQTLEPANLLSHTFPVETGDQLEEPLQDDFWDLIDAMPFETWAETGQSETESEREDSFNWRPGILGEPLVKGTSAGVGSSRVGGDVYIPNCSSRVLRSRGGRSNAAKRAAGSSLVLYSPRNNMRSAATMSSPVFVHFANLMSKLNPSTMNCGMTRTLAHTTQRVRRSLNEIGSKIRQFFHACGRKQRAEDVDTDSE